MIVEGFKILSSVFPFIKEAFLWRDGAAVGKPITQANLTRRKIAVFVLMGSLLTNYLSIHRLFEYNAEEATLQAQIAAYKNTPPAQPVIPPGYVPQSQVFDLAERQIEEEIHQGLLQRPSRIRGIKPH